MDSRSLSCALMPTACPEGGVFLPPTSYLHPPGPQDKPRSFKCTPKIRIFLLLPLTLSSSIRFPLNWQISSRNHSGPCNCFRMVSMSLVWCGPAGSDMFNHCINLLPSPPDYSYSSLPGPPQDPPQPWSSYRGDNTILIINQQLDARSQAAQISRNELNMHYRTMCGLGKSQHSSWSCGTSSHLPKGVISFNSSRRIIWVPVVLAYTGHARPRVPQYYKFLLHIFKFILACQPLSLSSLP